MCPGIIYTLCGADIGLRALLTEWSRLRFGSDDVGQSGHVKILADAIMDEVIHIHPQFFTRLHNTHHGILGSSSRCVSGLEAGILPPFLLTSAMFSRVIVQGHVRMS